MRYYLNEIPKVNDIINCKVIDIDEKVIHVKCLEYENIEGFVLLGDASKRKKKKSYCLMKINKKYSLLVKNINNENIVELSYKYIDQDNKKNILENLNKYEKSLRIFRYFISFVDKNLLNNKVEYYKYCNKTIWSLDKNLIYDHLYDCYINNNIQFDLSEDEKKCFKNALIKFFGKLTFTNKLVFNIKNANYEGVQTIINIFDYISNKYKIKIFIENIPLYYIKIVSNNKIDNEKLVLEIENELILQCQKNKCFFNKITQ